MKKVIEKGTYIAIPNNSLIKSSNFIDECNETIQFILIKNIE